MLEVNWKIEVLQNTGPQFLDALQTSFVVNIDETLTYDMPKVEDLENNAASEILIEPFTGYGDFYPEFMNTYFDNERLVFKPDGNTTLANTTSFFKVVLKEKGEGAISFSYYCTVYVECTEKQCPSTPAGLQPGGGLDINDDDDKPKIELFEVGVVDPLGMTSIRFKEPVDFNVLERDSDEIFAGYLQKQNYNYDPADYPLKSMSIENIDTEE